MQNILIVFFIASFIVMIMVFPFKTRFMGHFNLIELVGFYSLKIMKIKLINGKISYVGGDILIENSVDIIINKLNKDFSKRLFNQVIKRINVEKVEIFFNGGIADNSFSSAMICGGVSSLTESIYSYLSQNYYGVKLYEDIDAKFGNDNLELTFDLVISISFVSLLISLLNARKKKKGEV